MSLTEIICIIDNSGSMSPLTDDVIGGFNSFVEEQARSEEGRAVLTTILFNTTYNYLHQALDVREVDMLTRQSYIARGATAMFDAIGDAIESTQHRIDHTPVDERPDHVVVVIHTDGEDNRSIKFDKDKIKSMIEHQTYGHGWTFMFFGANMDAFSAAKSIGTTYHYNAQATAKGVSDAYTVATTAVNCVRGNVSMDALCNLGLKSTLTEGD